MNRRLDMPLIRRDENLAGHAEVEDLFQESGYLSLRDAQGDAASLWKRPSFANNISSDAVYRARDGKLLGHVSVTKAYSRAWLGHQLMSIKGHPESSACRREIYNHFSSVPLADSKDPFYLFGFYNRSLRWHQLFFENFVEELNDSTLACRFQLNRFEIDGPPSAHSGNVRPMDGLDMTSALNIIRSQLPPLALTAFDINENNLITSDLQREYHASGIERARVALTAHEDGALIGVALCDIGPRNFSLFNLLNFAHIYTAPAANEASRVNLFRAVVQFYNRRGIERPVIVSPSNALNGTEFRREESMGAIVWSANALRLYPAHVDRSFNKINHQSLIRG